MLVTFPLNAATLVLGVDTYVFVESLKIVEWVPFASNDRDAQNTHNGTKCKIHRSFDFISSRLKRNAEQEGSLDMTLTLDTG